jgi:biopolymer transport protein ExbD
MAFSFSSNGQARGRRRFGGAGELSEINIIPLVDVVLVLLIIFMLTAHVMESGLDINVPKTANTHAATEDFPIINITKEGETYIADKPVNWKLLGDEIRKRYKNPKAVYVRGDRELTYEGLCHVIDQLRIAKLDIQLVTQPIDAPSGRK